jgi:hypothetical protein
MWGVSVTPHPLRRRSDRPHPATAWRLFLLTFALYLAVLIAGGALIWKSLT